MNKIKEILQLIDSKYKVCFNKLICIPKVNEILKKLKIPTEKILSEEKLNKIARYGVASFIVLVCYFVASSGDSTYRGYELKKYTVSAENITKHIKTLGLKNPDFAVSDIKTTKLTKKMIDNGMSSYQLIEDTVKQYIDENIESLIDVNKSIDEALKYEYKKLAQDFSCIGKYGSIGQVKREEFINEQIFIEAAKKDKPIKSEDIIKNIKKVGFKHKYGSEPGIVVINFSDHPDYAKWLDGLKSDIENKINNKAKENILNKINESLLERLESDVSHDFSISRGKCELIKLINKDDLKKGFGEATKNKRIFDYILEKNNIKGFDNSIAKRSIHKRYAKEEVKPQKDGVVAIKEKLKNLNNPVGEKIQEIISDKNIGLAEFYNRLAELELNKIEKKMPFQPVENLFAFIRDYDILESEYNADISKTKKILENADKKEAFRKYVLAGWLGKNTLSDDEIEVIGKDLFEDKLKKVADDFYNNGLETYIYEYAIRPYVYAILKMNQFSTGIKDEITFEEEYNLIKTRLPNNLKIKAEKIFNAMPSEMKGEILSNDISLDAGNYPFKVEPRTSYSDMFLLFDVITSRYISPSGDFDDVDDLESSKVQSKVYKINSDPIQASRELACFKILDKAEVLIRESEKKNAEIAKEEARRKAEQDEKNFESMIADKSNIIISELLSLSKQLKGSEFKINITSVEKIRESQELKFSVPISEIDSSSTPMVILWDAKALIQEKQNPKKRTGQVSKEFSSVLYGNGDNYKVRFSVIFAGETLYTGIVKLMVVDEGKFAPYHISFDRSMLAFLDNNRDVFYSFDVFKKTPYYNNYIKPSFIAIAKDKYANAKNNGLVKNFPTKIKFKDIDESYDSSIFIKILLQSIRDAYDRAIPQKKHSDNNMMLGMLGAMSTAHAAKSGNAFDMKEFANALPFDSKTKNEIAKDSELSEFFNQIAYKQAAQAMIKGQVQLERERKVQSAYEQRLSRESEALALGMYDTSKEVSAGMIYALHKAILFILKDENISESDASKTLSFTGKITPYEEEVANRKNYIQKISLSEKAPNIAKRLLSNLKINDRNMPMSYYNTFVQIDFEATFSVKKSGDIFLPEIVLK